MKRTQYHHGMNRKKMTEIVPELDSKWSLMPMTIGNWRRLPAEVGDKVKKDCIWMPKRKDLAAGYYHLRTQESYIEIYDRFRRARLRRTLRKTKEGELYSKIKDVLYNPLLTNKPCMRRA